MTLYKKGSLGEVVKQIQKALYGAGFPTGCIDGIYGQMTRDAVAQFQIKKGLKADGIVGPATLALLFPQRLKKSHRTIKEIIVHCTATPEGQDVSIESIRRDHKAQGWGDIGYHYVINRKGEVLNGRDVEYAGVHCKGHNQYSIGVAYIGGLENKPGVPYSKQKPKDTRTLKQKAALLNLLTELRKLYPYAKIIGHRDTSPDLNGNGIVEPCEFVKACPSFDAKTEYRGI